MDKKALQVAETDIGRRVRIDEPGKPTRYGVITSVGGLRAYVCRDGDGYSTTIYKAYLSQEAPDTVEPANARR